MDFPGRNLHLNSWHELLPVSAYCFFITFINLHDNLSYHEGIYISLLCTQFSLFFCTAAKFVEDIVNGEIAMESSENNMGNNKLSQSTLQGSFEALMSMDMQSVENLVELAATSNSSAILSELNKNYSESLKYNNHSSSAANLSTRMESFIKSLSNANLFKAGLDSQQALGSLLLNASCSNFFDAGT